MPEPELAEPKSETMRTCNENEILIANYSNLTTTITEVDKLLPEFVQYGVILPEEEEVISAEKTSSLKVKKLLKHILGPLGCGNTKAFYTLLKIMKSKGKQPTCDLALNIEKSLNSHS